MLWAVIRHRKVNRGMNVTRKSGSHHYYSIIMFRVFEVFLALGLFY